MTELKPCPFCGGKAILVEVTDSIRCMNCCVRMGLQHGDYYKDLESLIAKWNTRTDNADTESALYEASKKFVW